MIVTSQLFKSVNKHWALLLGLAKITLIPYMPDIILPCLDVHSRRLKNCCDGFCQRQLQKSRRNRHLGARFSEHSPRPRGQKSAMMRPSTCHRASRGRRRSSPSVRNFPHVSILRGSCIDFRYVVGLFSGSPSITIKNLGVAVWLPLTWRVELRLKSVIAHT